MPLAVHFCAVQYRPSEGDKHGAIMDYRRDINADLNILVNHNQRQWRKISGMLH